MRENIEGAEKRIESEIEAVRKELQTETATREEKASSRLDDILSKKGMEFCSRCKKKVGSRTDWAGKCWWKDCENLLCRECWDVNKCRFCTDHSKRITGEPEEQAKKKEFFEEEDDDIKVDLRAMIDSEDDLRNKKLKYYTFEYANWLMKRMEKAGPIDWTPNEFLKKPEARMDRDDEDFVISLSVKGWFRRKTKLSVVVATFDSAGELDMNSLTAYLHRLSRKHKGYKLFVLVGDGAKLDAVNFVNKFADKDFSLYMVEPRKGNLYYNIKDTIANGYSRWFNQKSEPYDFKEKLKRLADLVSGRLIVSENEVAKEFGFRERDVHGILKSCPTLSYVKDTQTFVWKEPS